MTTQVATSQTVHRHTTPLKVIRRPPRSDVTQIIQKFLPYAVAFLLSLVVYSSFKSSPAVYPPYSPPNMFPEEAAPPVDFNSILSKRAERLEQIRSKGEASVDAKLGHWATWRAQKAGELDALKKTAEEQARQGLKVPVHVGEKLNPKSVINEAMDAAEWVKTYGEKIVEDVKEKGAEKLSNTQDFAYDAMYAWRQKAESIKNAAADKLDDLKEAGIEKAEAAMDVAQEKMSEIKESASEWVSSGMDALGELRDEVNGRAEGLMTGLASQAAYDMRCRGMAMEMLRAQNSSRATIAGQPMCPK